MARPKKIISEPTSTHQPKYMIDINNVQTLADIKAVLAYLVKDLKIPQDGDITGIAHLVVLK